MTKPTLPSTTIAWQPSATLTTLTERARILSAIRQFFQARGVLEVETPLMCHHTVTDPHVLGIPALYKDINLQNEQTTYLQTSPEYAMKRLLAEGSGPIFQITKAFRQGEVGHIHNPEFTMIEWYRPGFNHHALMDEMDDLLQLILQTPKAERISYADAFIQHLAINPLNASCLELKNCAAKHHLSIGSDTLSQDDWLDILWSHIIEPQVGSERPLFLYDFPASQASLAKLNPSNPTVASRFEVYFKGVELANGFHELQDANEQLKRFQADLYYRDKNQLPPIAIDTRLLAALEHGLPDCAGVALGLDRLIMLALGLRTVSEVISFSFARA